MSNINQSGPSVPPLSDVPNLSAVDISRFSPQLFLKTGSQAVRAAMDVIRPYQLGIKRFDRSEVKREDDTLVTVVDRASGKAIRDLLKADFPNAAMGIEDLSVTQPAADQPLIRFWIDGLDGTRPLTNGISTSTVILGAEDPVSRQIVACIIGEPSSGRLMYSVGAGTFVEIPRDPAAPITIPCKVSKDELGGQSTILYDLNKGFKRSGRTILTDQQATALFTAASLDHFTNMYGSNGLHHFSVALGGERLAGGFTTAIGGPWDVSGAFLIQQAGGACRAFKITSGKIEAECEPLRVSEYDLLVYGNSKSTVDGLTRLLERTLS